MFIVMKKIAKNGHERYYKIMIFLNLLNQVILYREYGNSSYKSATGNLEKKFDSFNIAKKMALRIKKERERRGYSTTFFSNKTSSELIHESI